MIVYPNPATNFISVKMKLVNEAEGSISLKSLNGKSSAVLYSGHFAQGDNDLRLTIPDKILPGLYILEIYVGSQKQIVKLVVQR